MRRLFAQPGFPRLFGGLSTSMLGDSVMLLVLSMWVKTLTGSNALAGLTFFFMVLPALAAPVLGVWVDRLPRKPILVWGNGSNATPADYAGVFRQLASWGFVVIGSSDSRQADGRTMLGSLRYLLRANLDPGSRFFGSLDPTEVGVLGHSQGAGGAVNAANHSGGLIDTVVPINLPDRRYVGRSGTFSVADLPVPALFLGGGTDGLISTPGGLRGYYQHVPRAALGILRGADHLAIQRTGGGYLGYLTAWLMWQLQDDTYAGSAFFGAGGDAKATEFRRNTRWQGQQARGLAE